VQRVRAAIRTVRPSKLLAEERRRLIVELLDSDGQVTINDLVDRFGVSAVTARADLDALSSAGNLIRSHGGAVRRSDQAEDYPLRVKEALHRAEKVRIGRYAAELVRANETIILDSGTTTAEIARHLKTLKLTSVTVITNALNIATELSDAPSISVIMLGGVLRPVSFSCVGPQAEHMLRELHADRLFLGVDGFDAEIGPSTPDILEAQLNGIMLQVAREVIVVADSSKLGRRSVSRIGPIEKVHRVITDNRITREMRERLVRRGVEVVAV
jgi:DeoR/GlpR family transcriptional regulator of sugar metabolism